ncbi:Peptidase S8 and S53, subtilisin, kexin, sedolisin domain protein [Candidatus Omnitrophus magneticus]|uniref:Peptidase S8 and S53, subtilisin, kexin, sedolisin domain protein n=1 Tax=Candidatus Omnitrophus magneticus TaxID=1609969 RepID=A0A0F0CJU8_9BACT|nr:Peptidase S8 and S53, subtilisin, kexin, sedolisin domain protein [Candidatus Omnitrophus magneticus]
MVKKKIYYANADYSNALSPNFTTYVRIYEYDASGNQTELYTYYNDATNYLESTTHASADGSGNVYYHYINENYNSQGYGRLDYQVLANADTDGAIGYYYEYHGATGVVKKKISYANANYSNPLIPSMSIPIRVTEYDASGNLINAYTYYNDATHYLESVTLASADTYGNVYYHYYNENYASQGYGRIDYQVLNTADTDGASGYWYDYHGVTNVVKKKISYANADYSNALSPNFTTYVRIYEYDASGNQTAQYTYYGDGTNYLESATHSGPDAFGNVYYHYYNENYNAQGYGRVDYQVLGSPDTYGASGYWYEYHGATGVVKKKISYANADYSNALSPNFTTYVRIYEYDASGNQTAQYTYYGDGTNYLESTTLPSADGSGNLYYHYKNENYASQGYGRLDYQVLASADSDGATGYYYEYNGATNVVKKKISYANANYSNPLSPSFTTMLRVFEYDTSGNLTKKYSYYNDGTNYLESQTLTSADTFGNKYYHYINENYNAQGYGRVDKQAANSNDSDGAIAYYYEYHTGTNTIKKKISYASVDYSSPGNPILTTMLRIFEYDSSSNLFVKYSYYNDGTNYLESSTLSSQDGSGNIYYHYINENYASQGYGRLDYQVLNSSQTYASYTYKGIYYEYNGATNTVSRKVYYNSASYTNPSSPSFTNRIADFYYDASGNETESYTYFYPSGYRESKKLVTPEADGTSYYYYYNENFNSQGYGRVKYQILNTADTDGAMGYYYEYYGGTNTVRKKISYVNAGYANPSSPIASTMLRVREYDTFGQLAKTFSYYNDAANLIESQTLQVADAYTNYYYHYINENYNNRGYGRIDKQVGSALDTDNAIAYEYQYHPGTEILSQKDCYGTADYTDPENPVFSDLKVTYFYDTSGNLITEDTIRYTLLSSYDATIKVNSDFGNAVSKENFINYSFGDGDDVTIALLDSGIDLNVLDIDILGGYDFAGTDYTKGLTDADYSDIIGHGTLTASVIKGNNGEGIASEADILAVKIFDDNGQTSSKIVSDAIYYALENGARILAMPFTIFPISSELEKALDYAVNKGAILVSAAGNNGTEIEETSLAAYSNAITVGALDSDGSKASWSNYGSEIDLYAPWDVITLEGKEGAMGTSFSVAFIAGLTADIISTNSEITNDEILQTLKEIIDGSYENTDSIDGDIEMDFLSGVMEESEVKLITPISSQETARIQGVNMEEALSKNEVIQQNYSEFGGYNLIVDQKTNFEQK